jgi:hypothetical protein
MNEKNSNPPAASPIGGGPKRRESQTQLLVLELQRLMREEIEKAVSAAMERTKHVAETVARSVANDVAQDVVQNALEAFNDPDGVQADLVMALKDTFASSSAPAKRRPARRRLSAEDAKTGSKAVARAGNNHIPVEIVSGPFNLEGRPVYRVKRLTKGKDFTGGMKPLEDLFVFTEEDAESLQHSSAPPSRRRAR